MTCEEGEASAELNVGNVRASLHNNGNLFYRPGNAARYEVPKGSGNTDIFAANLWIGGMVDGELRTAAADYSRFEFRPGPLFEDGSAPTDCTPYDRFWTVTREDIARYDATGTATADMQEWPVGLGAPVVDGDGNPDNYDLSCGDRPAIMGDQAVWWVMNDVSADHETTQTAPIGLQAQVMAFSFNQPGLLGKTTFYRYRLTYHGDAPWQDAYFGIWTDTDLGGAGDDRVGSDSMLSLGYTYNGDNDDIQYGDRPPALGYTMLRGPVGEDGERLGMTNFITYVGSSNPQGAPAIGSEYYNYLQSVWRDGVPVTVGRTGRGFSNERAHFMYPAAPPDFWSEENIDGQGTAFSPGDRRFLLSTGPFTMQPGETEEILFAIVWSRADEGAENPRLASHAKLESDVQAVRDRLAAIEQTPAPGQCVLDEINDFALQANFPEPVTGTTTLMLDLPEAATVRVEVYDALGRQVLDKPAQAMPIGRAQPIELDASLLSAGVYFYRVTVESDSGRRGKSGRMVVL